METERIGFLGTRFSGTDGVSLEAIKWAEVLRRQNHKLFWYGGRLDKPDHLSYCAPEAHFQHPEVQWINERIWGRTKRAPIVSRRIRDLSQYLKETIWDFVREYDISLLIVENALTIPMNLPLGVAIAEFLLESEVPAIAHHHDFYWERSRFMVNAVSDYLEMAFPPREQELHHVVINQNAKDNLAWRKGVSSHLIPNVLDFEKPPPESDPYAKDLRRELGLEQDDIVFLQPTRVVPRKGIEHSIQLLSLMENPKCKLVISHESGDEGYEYEYMLRGLAKRSGVDLHFVSSKVGTQRNVNDKGENSYNLWDLYPLADFVTYPSLYEGFGNAFLEAVYFKIPMLVNRYDIFMRDIEPKGFQVVTMDGFVTPDVAERVSRLIENDEARREVAEHNYQIARRYYSYKVLQQKLDFLIHTKKGETP